MLKRVGHDVPLVRRWALHNFEVRTQLALDEAERAPLAVDLLVDERECEFGRLAVCWHPTLVHDKLEDALVLTDAVDVEQPTRDCNARDTAALLERCELARNGNVAIADINVPTIRKNNNSN